MIQASDDRNAPEPFLLQRQNRALGDRHGTVLAHRAKAVLDVPVPQQLCEHLTDEDALPITDDVTRRAVP